MIGLAHLIVFCANLIKKCVGKIIFLTAKLHENFRIFSWCFVFFGGFRMKSLRLSE